MWCLLHSFCFRMDLHLSLLLVTMVSLALCRCYLRLELTQNCKLRYSVNCVLISCFICAHKHFTIMCAHSNEYVSQPQISMPILCTHKFQCEHQMYSVWSNYYWNCSPGIQTGETALYHAAQEGKAEIVQLLLSQNTNVDHQRKVSYNLIFKC